MLTSNFQYFTGYDQHMLENESAVSQTYYLLFCLTSSQNEKRKCITVRECVCACVSMYVCIL